MGNVTIHRKITFPGKVLQPWVAAVSDMAIRGKCVPRHQVSFSDRSNPSWVGGGLCKQHGLCLGPTSCAGLKAGPVPPEAPELSHSQAGR